ncbi:MAG: alpha/beta fold hydrolase [Simkaniaceae bacterium]
MPSSKALLIPGFYGSPDDFTPLRTYLLGEFHPIDLPTCLEDLLQYGPDLTLIGYSMGGRISLMFYQKYPHLVKQVIAISSNPFRDDSEKRKNWEQQWLDNFDRWPKTRFLKAWYNQEIFTHLKTSLCFPDVFQNRLKNNPLKMKEAFNRFRLSSQPNFGPNFNNWPVQFFFGQKDTKYATIHKILISKGMKSALIKDSSHAPHLETPKNLAGEMNGINFNHK